MWSVEKGTRPLRLSEAVDVAWILSVLVDDLIEPREGEARFQQEVSRAKSELTGVIESIEARIARLQHDSLVDEVSKAQRRWEASKEGGDLGGKHQEAP